jgi:GT2 family glycosyltransferase
MKLSIVIPVLYSSKNLWYLKAIDGIEKSWKKYLSTAKNKKVDLEIIVVFNQSQLNTKVSNPKLRGIDISILKHPLNKGFTGAVNDGAWQAFFQSKADWCLVLNDDTFLFDDFFIEIIPRLKNEYAVVSCGIANTDGSLQCSGINYLLGGLTKPAMKFSDNLKFFSGTAFIVSKETALWSFDTFGFLLINFFFAYAEDLELGVRLLRNKKKVYVHPKILLTHFGSVTAKRGSERQLYWGYRNLIFLMIVHWSSKRILTLLPFVFFAHIYIIGFLIYRGYFVTYPKIIGSIWKKRKILFFYRKQMNEKLASFYTI